MFSAEEIRRDFKIFSQPENEGLVYLDSAATAHRPECVIQAEAEFYRKNNANPLRGLYGLSIRATDDYENARAVVAKFLNAAEPAEVVFTRNASESLNLVAYTLGLSEVQAGDEIAISCMEHHSNILPWQMVCNAKGAKLVWLECDSSGVVSEQEIKAKINSRTKIVAVTQVSNVFGITNPIEQISAYARKVGNGGKGAYVVVDGAQSAPHKKVDVQKMGADFFAFSGHKLCAPMGIGALYGKKQLLEKIPPFMRGGEMIEYVTREGATFAEVPHKFEAGTVNAGGAVALARAVEYVQQIGLDNIESSDDALARTMIEGMKQIPYLHIIGSDDYRKHCGIVTFTIDGVHPHDIASILDTEKIAVRAGHHCAQPLMQKLGVGSTARASCYFYNTQSEVEIFIEKLKSVRRWMGFKD